MMKFQMKIWEENKVCNYPRNPSVTTAHWRLCWRSYWGFQTPSLGQISSPTTSTFTSKVPRLKWSHFWPNISFVLKFKLFCCIVFIMIKKFVWRLFPNQWALLSHFRWRPEVTGRIQQIYKKSREEKPTKVRRSLCLAKFVRNLNILKASNFVGMDSGFS